MGVLGVQLASNYFEANNGYAGRPFTYMRPALDNTTAPVIKISSDIVLNGAPSFHDGSSDYTNWGLIDWQYGRAYCPSSVVVQGNTHAPSENGSAVFIVCGNGLSFTGNMLSLQGRKNTALVETGTDASLFGARRVFFKANTLYSDKVIANATNTLIRLLPTKKDYNGGVGLESWQVEDSPTQHRKQNVIRYDRALSKLDFDVMQPKQALALMQATIAPAGCVMTLTDREMDRYSILSVKVASKTSQCGMTVATLDVAAQPEFAGQPVYMLVQANISLPGTSVALSIDPSDGGGPRISADWDISPGSWTMLEYQMTLGSSGLARFGLHIGSANTNRATEGAVDIAAMVIAKVGDEWSRLL